MTVDGLLLAAGEGRRMGTPKALLRDDHGVAYVSRALGRLLEGGCRTVTVVLGAAADEVRTVLDTDGWTSDDAVRLVLAADYAEGMGASLRTGLQAAADGDAVAVLVSLVDLPDVDDSVVTRVLGCGPDTTTLARAVYDGRAGHPVLLGREHWAGIVATARGDRGARDYLAGREVLAVECGDLATGRDRDRPADL